MNPLHTVALAKTVKEPDLDDARPNIAVGTHKLDFTVRIRGRMTVGKDYDTTPTVSLSVKEILAFAFRRFGCTREQSLEFIRDAYAAKIAATNGSGGNALSERAEYVEAAQPIIDAMLARLPQQSRYGPVRTYFAVEEVQTVTPQLPPAPIDALAV